MSPETSTSMQKSRAQEGSFPSVLEEHLDETSPLLPASTSSRPTAQPEYVEWLTEIWFLTKASIPVILAYMLQNSLQTASILVAGRISSEALAVAAFSYMFAMATA